MSIRAGLCLESRRTAALLLLHVVTPWVGTPRLGWGSCPCPAPQEHPALCGSPAYTVLGRGLGQPPMECPASPCGYAMALAAWSTLTPSPKRPHSAKRWAEMAPQLERGFPLDPGQPQMSPVLGWLQPPWAIQDNLG